jgi:hypothetical protein
MTYEFKPTMVNNHRPWICLNCIHVFDDKLLKVCICLINEKCYWDKIYYGWTQKCEGYIFKKQGIDL